MTTLTYAISNNALYDTLGKLSPAEKIIGGKTRHLYQNLGQEFTKLADFRRSDAKQQMKRCKIRFPEASEGDLKKMSNLLAP